MDWHLMQKYSLGKQKDRSFLRERLQFPKVIYYGAIIISSFVRFTWILKCITISNEGMQGLDIFLILSEMFRRWIWVFFRLEREWFLVSPLFSSRPPEGELLNGGGTEEDKEELLVKR
jgi:hypothetical protein